MCISVSTKTFGIVRQNLRRAVCVDLCATAYVLISHRESIRRRNVRPTDRQNCRGEFVRRRNENLDFVHRCFHEVSIVRRIVRRHRDDILEPWTNKAVNFYRTARRTVWPRDRCLDNWQTHTGPRSRVPRSQQSFNERKTGVALCLIHIQD